MSRRAVEMTIAGQPVPCIEIDGKTVEFEDGTTENVAPFIVTRQVVTYGQFRRFVEATRYVTTVEKSGFWNESWKDNEFITGLSSQELEETSVNYISYLDVLEFCKWCKWRLPTDAEWMAASLVNDHVIGESEWSKLFGYRGTLDPLPETYLIYEGFLELTGTLVQFDDDQFCVQRRDPQHIRTLGWNKLRDVRFGALQELDHPTQEQTFRLCRSR